MRDFFLNISFLKFPFQFATVDLLEHCGSTLISGMILSPDPFILVVVGGDCCLHVSCRAKKKKKEKRVPQSERCNLMQIKETISF